MAAKKRKKRKNSSIKQIKGPDKIRKPSGAKKAKKAKKVTKAKKVNALAPLYSYTRSKTNDPLSRKVFNKKPSTFTKEEFNKLIKGVNDRLYKLEKAGLAQESKAYQNIMRYAMGGDPAYNVDTEKGTVRLTQDMSRFKTKQELYDYINRAQQILSNQTSSVGGTNRAIKKAYETFMKNPQMYTISREGKMIPLQLSLEEYRNIWKAYKSNVEPDEKGKYESQTVIDYIHATRAMGYYDIPPEQMGKAFKYYAQQKDQYEDMFAFMINNPDVFSEI